MASADWSNLDVAGAFALGAFLAAVATIRILRVVAREWRNRDN